MEQIFLIYICVNMLDFLMSQSCLELPNLTIPSVYISTSVRPNRTGLGDSSKIQGAHPRLLPTTAAKVVKGNSQHHQGFLEHHVTTGDRYIKIHVDMFRDICSLHSFTSFKLQKCDTSLKSGRNLKLRGVFGVTKNDDLQFYSWIV